MPDLNTTQNDGLLNTQELADRLKVSVKAVRKWAKAGCPIARLEPSAHGRPGMRFDLKAVRLWLISTGNVSRAMLAAPEAVILSATVPQAEAPATAEAQPTPAPSAGCNFLEALSRARNSEAATFALWASMLKSDPLTASAHHARWIAAADCLLRLEKAKEEVLLAEKKMIRTDDAQEATAHILQAIRIDLEAMPNAIAPRLTGTVPEMAATLRAAVQDVLRHIHGGSL